MGQGTLKTMGLLEIIDKATRAILFCSYLPVVILLDVRKRTRFKNGHARVETRVLKTLAL